MRSSMLRSQGYAMPDSQLRRVLGREYGRGWEERFARFDMEPAAAASIGQIHRARTHGGRELALKVQFPGVARSVDSDVNNLASLLRRLDFLPVTVDIDAIAAEAKRQLHLETDYESEARNLERYAKLVADMPAVVVPRIHRALTTRRILAMDWMDGDPLEALASEAVPQATRNAVARTLQDLHVPRAVRVPVHADRPERRELPLPAGDAADRAAGPGLGRRIPAAISRSATGGCAAR